MAAAPVFASAGRVGNLSVANGDGTTETAAVITGVAAGTRIREIRLVSGPTTAPGTAVVQIRLTNGVTDTIIDTLTLTNTANLVQGVLTYTNLILPSSSWSIKIQMSAAITSGGTLHVTALGEDLT